MEKLSITHIRGQWTCDDISRLINLYGENGGNIWEIEEGCLGYGLTILTGDKLKTAVIQEYYINEWSSGHKVRFYNKIPKKYQDMIDNLE